MSAGEDTRLTRELVIAKILGDQKFILASHEKPDGDAIGSMAAMQGLLTALGKDSVMFISPGDLPLPDEYTLFALARDDQRAPAGRRARGRSCSSTAATWTATRPGCCATDPSC